MPSNSRRLALLLGLLLLGVCAGCDWFTRTPQLSIPLLVAAAISALVCALGVPRLRNLKLGQVIRQEGPQSHLSKAGTPTMGGLLVVPVGVLVGGLIAPSDLRLPGVAAITLAYMAIGGFDDWRSLTKRHNTGLSPSGKLLLQGLSATAFLAWAAWHELITAQIALPLGWVLPLGLLIWPLGLFVFLAESNATNLTDGLDGLAAGCGAIVLVGLSPQLMLRGNGGDPALAGYVSPGGCLAWLSAPQPPSRPRVHGGYGIASDGVALTAIALLSNSLWPLLLMGGLLLAESLSVILQVWVFKATKGADGQGKRLLRMAPLHHHFELGGWSERRVVVSFWGVSLLLVALDSSSFPKTRAELRQLPRAPVPLHLEGTGAHQRLRQP